MCEIEETIRETFDGEYNFRETINLMTDEELKDYIRYYTNKQIKNLKIMMKQVVVYLKEDYSINESIWVSEDLTKEQITNEVNKNFKEWYSYDII